MKDHIFESDEVVPVIDDQILLALRPTAIVADIRMKELGIRNQPGLIIKAEFGRWGSLPVPLNSSRLDTMRFPGSQESGPHYYPFWQGMNTSTFSL